MIRKGFKYTAKYVRHKATQSGQKITEFQIGSRVKNGEGFWNVRVTIWGGLDIADGDVVFLDKIQSIEAREHEGKLFFDMTAFVHVDEGANTPKDKDIQMPFDLD